MKINERAFAGYIHGAIQPTVLLRISDLGKAHRDTMKDLASLTSVLSTGQDTAMFEGPAPKTDGEQLAFALVRGIDTLSQHCGDQRFTPIKVFQTSDAVTFAIPTLSTTLIRALVLTLKQPLTKLAKGRTPQHIKPFADDLKRRYYGLLPIGTNQRFFIQAAAERRIPFFNFENRFLFFGYGTATTRFHSSITDRESFISVALAKSKSDTNRLLRMAGLPVAQQYRAPSLKTAVKRAGEIGYPVILKPNNREQGVGIHTFIQDEQELTEIYNTLAAEFPTLILEDHIHGDGYRVSVSEGRIARVRKLSAAHVIGDGQRSITALINAENASAIRNAASSSWKKIRVDDTLISLAGKQGYTLDDVPDAGVKVVLSPTTNLSRGGASRDFMSELHPDNAALCIAASRAIGLSYSGVDLISKDASVSWKDNNTIVCEVNAQPQIGADTRIDIHNTMVWSSVPDLPEVTLTVTHEDTPDMFNLFDKTREKLDLRVSAKHLLANGCPTQYFDRLHIEDAVPETTRKQLQGMLVSVLPLHTHRTNAT